jgi:hypothetical protein
MIPPDTSGHQKVPFELPLDRDFLMDRQFDGQARGEMNMVQWSRAHFGSVTLAIFKRKGLERICIPSP